MALYHFHVGHVSRGAGQAAVSASAYRSGEKLYDAYYDETPDYTRKGGVIYSEIILPPHAPERLLDRGTLWNEVERTEKHPKAQLAYSFDIALQNELTAEENIALARRFVKENFTDRGMIADLAVHDPDRGNGGIQNPHFHVLCPIRPLTADGTWGAKQRREYLFDEHGCRMTGKNGKYIFNALPTIDWNSPETLKLWRRNWAALVNDAFMEKGVAARVDARSYEERGMDTIPSIHEGPAVCAMESKGAHTDKRSWNDLIKDTNSLVSRLARQIAALAGWIAKLKKLLDEERAAQSERQEQENMLIRLLTSYYDSRNASAYSNKARANNLKQQAEIINFLHENNIHSIDGLSRKVTDMYNKVGDVSRQLKANEAEARDIRKILDAFGKFQANRPAYDRLRTIKGKTASEKFKEEHRTELSLFYMARRMLSGEYPDGGPVPVQKLNARLRELSAEHDDLKAQYSELRSEAGKIYSIKKAVEADYRNTIGNSERAGNREKKHKPNIHR